MPAYKKVISDYAEVFDFYYTDDEAFASTHFNTRQFHEFLPTIRIIDPNKLVPLSYGSMKSRKENTSPLKIAVPFSMQMDEELPKHIEKFLDGEVSHYYESENNIP